MSAQQDFLKSHTTHTGEGCLFWPFRLGPDGYGRIAFGGWRRSAAAWMCHLAHGECPSDKDECAHSCGNPTCVHPGHLRWATHAENMADKKIHGTEPRGADKHCATLTNEQALAIYNDRQKTPAIAKEYGIPVHRVRQIKYGVKWAWLTGHRKIRSVPRGVKWKHLELGMKRTNTDFIIVHCSATHPGLDWGAAEIERMHQQAFKWARGGYNYIIRRSGAVEVGRPEDEQGAHAKGWNHCSIGVCLIGGVNIHQKPEDNFEDAQMDSLERLLGELKNRYPDAIIMGHRDTGANKACPSFEVRSFCADRMLQSGDVVFPKNPPK